MSVFDDLGHYIGHTFHKLIGAPTSAEKRQAAAQVNEQIKAYKDQTEITRKELAAKKDEQIAEKRRIDEKQIRALRRNYRAPGFLGTQAPTMNDMSSKLGG